MVRPLTAAPELDGWAIAERLLKDLTWLAIESGWWSMTYTSLARARLGGVELLVMRGRLELRLVLTTRRTCGWACTSCGWSVVLG